MGDLPPRPNFSSERRPFPSQAPRRRDDSRPYNSGPPYPPRDRDRDSGYDSRYDGRRDDFRRERDYEDREYDSRDRDRDRDRDRRVDYDRRPPPTRRGGPPSNRFDRRGPPPRSPPRFAPSGSGRYHNRSPPRRRSPSPRSYRGSMCGSNLLSFFINSDICIGAYSRSPSPRRYSRSPARSPHRRHMLPTSPVRPQLHAQPRRSRSPLYPSKRLKLGSHSIESPSQHQERSRSRDSRYKPPGYESPRDEGEIREYDTPDRDDPPTAATKAPESSQVVPEESKPSPKRSPSPKPPPKPPSLPDVIVGDIEMHSPSSVPLDEASTSSMPPNSLPTTPLIPQKPPLRSTSPPKHPRNWPEPSLAAATSNNTTNAAIDPSPIFIPNSLRRGRGRNSGPYRGGSPSYRGGGGGGGPPDAPRALRNRGPVHSPSALAQEQDKQQQQQEQQQESSIATLTPRDVDAPSLVDPASTHAQRAASISAPPPPSEKPDDLAASFWELINQEMQVDAFVQEERSTAEYHKQLRDDVCFSPPL